MRVQLIRIPLNQKNDYIYIEYYIIDGIAEQELRITGRDLNSSINKIKKEKIYYIL